MRSIIALAAEVVIRDAENNSISVFNILEGVVAEGFPMLVPRVAHLVLWEREAREGAVRQGRLSVHLDERQLFSQPLVIDFQQFFRSRTISIIQGLVIPGPGQLRFSLSIDDGPTAVYTVPISATAQAGPPQVVVQDNPA